MDSGALTESDSARRLIDSVIGKRLTVKHDQPNTLKLAGPVRHIVSPTRDTKPRFAVWGKTLCSSGFEPFPFLYCFVGIIS
jgi:hypothetical protein